MKNLNQKRKEFPSQIEPKLREKLMKYPNVTDVGFGLKMKNNKFTKEIVVIAFVKKKLPKYKLSLGSIIPKKLIGSPIDVQEELNGSFFIADGDSGFNLSRVRPLISGICISPKSSPSTGGTLGCFAARNSDGKKVLVSNYHVLFRNTAPLPGESPITENNVYQPTVEDANLIAKVDVTDPNFGSIGGEVDCAYAVLEEEGSSCFCTHTVAYENIVDNIRLKGVATALIGKIDDDNTTVYKYGIAPPYKTAGKIVDISKTIPVEVDYSNRNLIAGNTFKFSNLMMIVNYNETTKECDASKPFAVEGDSGSLIYNANHEIVGLHFLEYVSEEQDKHYSFASHIKSVESALKITISGTRNYVSAIQPPASIAIAAMDVELPSDSSVFVPAEASALSLNYENQLHSFFEKISKTESGKIISGLINLHGYEVMRHINRRREVTIAWHRAQGPSFVAALNRAANHPEYKIPFIIAGISFTDMLLHMGDILVKNGSEELKKSIEQYLPVLLKVSGSIKSSGTLTDIWCQFQSLQNCITNSIVNG